MITLVASTLPAGMEPLLRPFRAAQPDRRGRRPDRDPVERAAVRLRPLRNGDRIGGRRIAAGGACVVRSRGGARGATGRWSRKVGDAGDPEFVAHLARYRQARAGRWRAMPGTARALTPMTTRAANHLAAALREHGYERSTWWRRATVPVQITAQRADLVLEPFGRRADQCSDGGSRKLLPAHEAGRRLGRYCPPPSSRESVAMLNRIRSARTSAAGVAGLPAGPCRRCLAEDLRDGARVTRSSHGPWTGRSAEPITEEGHYGQEAAGVLLGRTKISALALHDRANGVGDRRPGPIPHAISLIDPPRRRWNADLTVMGGATGLPSGGTILFLGGPPSSGCCAHARWTPVLVVRERASNRGPYRHAPWLVGGSKSSVYFRAARAPAVAGWEISVAGSARSRCFTAAEPAGLPGRRTTAWAPGAGGTARPVGSTWRWTAFKGRPRALAAARLTAGWSGWGGWSISPSTRAVVRFSLPEPAVVGTPRRAGRPPHPPF